MSSLFEQTDAPAGLALVTSGQRHVGVLAAAASGLCGFIEKQGGDPERCLECRALMRNCCSIRR